MDRPIVEEPRRRGLTARSVLIALLAPAVAALISIPLSRTAPASPISVFLLASVIAAVVGGVWSGVIAAALSAVILPIVLSDDRVGFAQTGPEAIVATVVFLAVAIVVGLLVGGASEDRARASRREREARLLGYLSDAFLGGEVPDRILDEFAEVLIEPFALATCEVVVDLDGQRLHARAVREGVDAEGPSTVVPLVVATVSFGTLTVTRPGQGRAFTRDEEALLQAAARQAAAALDRARLDARVRLAQLDAETNQLRAAMFSSVTHDLRTPLASIKAGVTSLLDPSVDYTDEQERELLTTILEETDRLNRLVGNILDLARIRAGALIPTRHRAGLDEIVEAVVARLAPRLRGEGVRIMTEIAAETPDVSVDEMQIDQVVTNLIENAARYTPADGQVEVGLDVVDDAVRVRVRDHGPGIAPEDAERVFEPFYRGGRDPETPGTGLGLAIVKAIVTAHGGDVTIESPPGGGTAMVVRIPTEETSS